MNLYKYRVRTGSEGYRIAELYSKCEEAVRQSGSYEITKIELIEKDVITQKE